MTPMIVFWIVGALLAFAFGLWAGLGYPGWYDRRDTGGPTREARMDTWLNRWIFGGPRPRRFSTKHLIVPRGTGRARNEHGSEESEPEERATSGHE
jgi:hypothetical protein